MKLRFYYLAFYFKLRTFYIRTWYKWRLGDLWLDFFYQYRQYVKYANSSFKSWRSKKTIPARIALPRPLRSTTAATRYAYLHLLAIFMGLGVILVVLGVGSYQFFVPASTRFYYHTFYIEPYIKRFLPLEQAQATKFSAVQPLIVLPYQVVPGDTYWDIAKKTGISIDTLLSYNQPKDSFSMHPNEILYIPLQDGIVHHKKADETVFSLSAQYNISAEKINFFNPNWEDSTQLFIPGAYFSFYERLEKLGGEFSSPLAFFRITSVFGMRIHPITKRRSFHNGIDLGASVGTPVLAASSGRVIVARSAQGYGNIVMISHGGDKFTRYAHLLNFSVTVGQRVTRGQTIGYVGSSGLSTGPHLHFEVWKNNKPINPFNITDFFSKK